MQEGKEVNEILGELNQVIAELDEILDDRVFGNPGNPSQEYRSMQKPWATKRETDEFIKEKLQEEEEMALREEDNEEDDELEYYLWLNRYD
tara:strand:+ start:783 stop:1055 length:273 start_codon:yes stop_codon:yes gene_type:complete